MVLVFLSPVKCSVRIRYEERCHHGEKELTKGWRGNAMNSQGVQYPKGKLSPPDRPTIFFFCFVFQGGKEKRKDSSQALGTR